VGEGYEGEESSIAGQREYSGLWNKRALHSSRQKGWPGKIAHASTFCEQVEVAE